MNEQPETSNPLKQGSTKAMGLGIAGAAVAMGLCCGLPLLITAGAFSSLGAIGAGIASPLLIIVAVFGLIGLSAVWFRQRGRHRCADGACPVADHSSRAHDRRSSTPVDR